MMGPPSLPSHYSPALIITLENAPWQLGIMLHIVIGGHWILECVSRIKQFPFDGFGCLSEFDCVIMQSNPKSKHEERREMPQGRRSLPYTQ
jgi:hypothetical protein